MSASRLDTDITIIGGGGAGVAAALEAGDAGARFVLIEQDETLGGTAATSGGGCLIVGLEGTMLGPAIFSGRVAGGWAAHEAGFGGGFIGKANRGE